MRSFVLFTSLLLSFASQACLNLTGKLSGSCVYRSPVFGDLEGSIEFDIQQPSCDQITLDGSSLKIPGEFSQKSKDGNVENFTKLTMSWQNTKQEVLSYNYNHTADENGKRLDDVALKGTFRRQGKKIILEQAGVVDSDPVKIYCELF